MSDVQDNIMLQQRQIQQRQILAMMGIPLWVQTDSPTLNMADIALPESTVSHNLETDIHGLSVELAATELSAPLYNAPVLSSNEAILESSVPTSSQSPVALKDEIQPYEPVEKTYNIDTLSHSSSIAKQSVDAVDNQKACDDQATVAPFDLQGGCYGNWVLLVDIQALTRDSQKLWQNITQALSLSCETSSFPICAGMETTELANASLAGYIFKLGRQEDIHVAVLTDLSSGLSHPNFISVPKLDAMLRDASLKRSLWLQLHE
ncbi:hypothetical protein [Psychrobacter sp. 16-MNA-CIBAN-0192]|uniref:hypothetical protein n=1 Tax=Psychrobacter sp. 16-MNA-CIBAN-0192 TaxID=3140448 RepID=UPI00332EE5D2